MPFKSTKIFIFMLGTLLLISSISGASAVWIYSEDPARTKTETMGISLSEFVWAPEEILPDEVYGENYLDLLNSILNNDKGGLNGSKNTLYNAVIKDEVVHSSQNVQGGNLKHLFITEESRELDFIVEYISNYEFNVYMYENDDVRNGLVDSTKIKVYKTILIKEGTTWIGQESQLGYSTLRYVPNTSFIGIAPAEWTKGDLRLIN